MDFNFTKGTGRLTQYQQELIKKAFNDSAVPLHHFTQQVKLILLKAPLLNTSPVSISFLYPRG